MFPTASLADLYDESAMPPELRKAHRENDKAVMQAYGFSVTFEKSQLWRQALLPQGLAISEIETEWKQYPVLYFDFTGKTYASVDDLTAKIDDILSGYEAIYGKNTASSDIAIRFKNVIKAAHDKTGRQAVVLVDEYDKPLLQNVTDTDVEDNMRDVLKGFYGNLKSDDAGLKL